VIHGIRLLAQPTRNESGEAGIIFDDKDTHAGKYVAGG
jgi:hypothetical protein